MRMGVKAAGGMPATGGRAAAAQQAPSHPVRAGADAAPAARPRRGLSYRASLILSLTLLVAATGAVVSYLAFRGARSGTAALAHALFQEVSDHAVTRTRAYLLRAVPLAETLGNLSDLGLSTDESDQLSRQLTAVLKANPGVSWVSYGNEQGTFVGAYRTASGTLRVNQSRIEGGKTKLVEYDVAGDSSWKLARREDDSEYDPRKRPFYRLAREARKLVWAPPYVFYEQSVPGVTCANPVYGRDGALRGVLTVDFDLNTLSQFVQKLPASANSRLFIMSGDGVLLAHPTQRLAVRSGQRGRGELMTVADVGDPVVRAFDVKLRAEEAAAPLASAEGARQFEFEQGRVEYFARSTRFRIDGDLVWIVGAMAPKSDFLAAARRSIAWSLAASLAALGAAVVVAMLLARRVSGPILALVSFVQGVGRGDLSARPRLGGAREFRELSGALDRMIDDLRDRTRMRSALAVATEVQQALLPAGPPRVEGLDVAAFSVYCDETGGDYYDYIAMDGERSGAVLFAVGDVMGHGIGSALVMASARAVLRNSAARCTDLGQLLTRVNAQLVPDMVGRRYVTMLLWMVDPKSGSVRWANAGHQPAIVYDPATDSFDQSGQDGIPLGFDEAAVYGEYAYGPVREGLVMVLATDGVWEMQNAQGEFFGMERLKACVRVAAGGTAEQIAGAVRAELEAFRDGAVVRDDVTLVVIKRVGFTARPEPRPPGG